jgi:hypothetical protein
MDRCVTQSYPLHWPAGWARTALHKRKRTSLFKTTFVKAREELWRELNLLGARYVVVSSWLPVRADGHPYADAARRRIEDPGVAVYFQLNGRPMTMARDQYETVHDNLRSIGLAVQHLRGLERHGGGAMMERAFEGFAALPPPKDCWAILGVPRDASIAEIRAAYFERAAYTHPDRGGDTNAMADLNWARDAAEAAAKSVRAA